MLRSTHILLFVSIWINSLQAHETFLRPDKHKIEPGEALGMTVVTGTFDRSVFPQPITTVDKLKYHSANGTYDVDYSDWNSTNSTSKIWRFKERVASKLGGTDLRDTSSFSFTPQNAGTLIVGIDFKQERIAQDYEAFNKYITTEAHSDLSAEVLGFNEPSDIIVEGYTKIAKTIIQVGDEYTENVTQPIGQRIEIVPLMHPSRTKKGDTLKLQALHLGIPLQNQSILVSRKPGALKKSMDLITVYKTNDAGIIEFPVTDSGIWWANTIFLEPTSENQDLNVLSLWGSLTFEIN
ncbi:DUF4198 domain-containing protein [Opitutia bacterium ISCC 51]|nr:DUF4198 domain-containing protein [Opitutae bacterium ISCC 51]QXD29989.1 DUF4198 domain-containing protein [Opitutae bacterium ISCC 52]